MGSESVKEPRAQARTSWKKRSLALVRCASLCAEYASIW